MEYMLDANESGRSTRTWLLVIIPYLTFILLAGLLQSWDATWVAVLFGLAPFIMLRGTTVETHINGDPTNRRMEFGRYSESARAGSAIAVAVGLLISNIAWPGFLGFTLWGALLVMAVVEWKGTSLKQKLLSNLESGPSTPKRPALSPEQAAVQRFHPNMLVAAGLGRKSEATGLMVPPTVSEARLDAKGRPCFGAKMFPGEQTFMDWKDAEQRIASAWQVLRAQVEPGLNSDGSVVPGTVFVTGIASEFKRTGPVPFQSNRTLIDSGLDVVQHLSALRVGEMYDSADPWVVSLTESNWVVGGIPGTGKSVFLNVLLAHLAEHPHIEIGMIDLKGGVEGVRWENRLSHFTYDAQTAADVIEWLDKESMKRYDELRSMVRDELIDDVNAWKVPGYLGAERPVRVLVLDECGQLFREGSKEARELAARNIDNLTSLISRGRAAGYVIIMATQKPTVNTLPSSVRDLASDAVSFKQKRLSGSQATLGEDAFTDDVELMPTSIAKSQKGQAITASEDGDLQRVQCALITNDQIKISARSAWGKGRWMGWKPGDDLGTPGWTKADAIDNDEDVPVENAVELGKVGKKIRDDDTGLLNKLKNEEKKPLIWDE